MSFYRRFRITRYWKGGETKLFRSAMGVKMEDTGIKLEKLIAYGSKEAVVQNLKDAGCTQDIIEGCMACMQQGKKNELLKRLEEHRNGLLDRVHKEEKHIDCLDYLVYQIRRC